MRCSLLLTLACWIIVALLGQLTATAAESTPGAVATPMPMPEFSVRTLDGETITRASLAGKVVVVNFWATWCADCRFALPEYVKLNEQFGSHADFVFLAISLDERPEEFVRTFAQKNGVNYRVAVGNDALAESFGGIDEIPTTFVFDRSGQRRFKQGVSIKYGELTELLRALLSNEGSN